jgi:hypothetical protein
MRYIFLSSVGSLLDPVPANRASFMVVIPRWWLNGKDHVFWKVSGVYVVSHGRYSQYDQDNDGWYQESHATD